MGTLLGQQSYRSTSESLGISWVSPLIMGLSPFRMGTPSPLSHHSPRKLEIMRHHTLICYVCTIGVHFKNPASLQSHFHPPSCKQGYPESGECMTWDYGMNDRVNVICGGSDRDYLVFSLPSFHSSRHTYVYACVRGSHLLLLRRTT